MSRKNGDPCTYPECPGKDFSRGLCMKHYSRWRRHGDPAIQGRRVLKDKSFEELIDRSGGPDACWPWQGSISQDGYGRWNRDYTEELAHREAWRRSIGEPPPKESGLVLDHGCHDPRTCPGGSIDPHRRCCNPTHLTVATFLHNFSAERNVATRRLSECHRGHPLTPDNLYVYDGRRRCKACVREVERLRRLR